MAGTSRSLGQTLALTIGVAGVLGAVVVVATGREPIVAAILVLVGGSALNGWLKSRRRA